MFILDSVKLGRLLKYLLIIIFIVSIPTIIVLPFFLNHNYSIIYSIVIVYPNGLLMLGIMYNFIRLFKSLEDNNPFNYNNVKILKNTGIISFIMSILWIIDLLIMIFLIKNTYINYVIVLLFLFLLFFGVSIALLLLCLLFKQATDYKTENDLTI